MGWLYLLGIFITMAGFLGFSFIPENEKLKKIEKDNGKASREWREANKEIGVSIAMAIYAPILWPLVWFVLGAGTLGKAVQSIFNKEKKPLLGEEEEK